MSSLIPRSSGGIERHGKSSSPDKRVAYQPASAVGWFQVPSHTRSVVASQVGRMARRAGSSMREQMAATVSLSEGMGPAVVHRHPDGTRQHQTAWWVGPMVLVQVEMERELEQRDDGRYTPVDGWEVTRIDYRPLTGVEVDHHTYARRAGGAGGSSAPPPATTTSDPLELLPTSVVAPLRAHLVASDCWTRAGRTGGHVEETVCAYSLDGDHLIALRATRTAASDADLPSAPWEVTTTSATVGQAEHPALSAAAKPALPPPRRSLGRALRALGR